MLWNMYIYQITDRRILDGNASEYM